REKVTNTFNSFTHTHTHRHTHTHTHTLTLTLSLSLVTRKHTHTLKNTFHMDTKHCRILFLFFSLPSVTRPLLRNQVKAISKLINREERNTQGPLETYNLCL